MARVVTCILSSAFIRPMNISVYEKKMRYIAPYNAWPDQNERNRYNVFKRKFRKEHDLKRNRAYYRIMRAAYIAHVNCATLDRFVELASLPACP